MSKELFTKILNTLQKEGMFPEHQSNCSYQDTPLNSAPCSCLAYYWFLQGLHATQAECVIKILNSTDESNHTVGIYRCTKVDGQWSDWEAAELSTKEKSND